MNVGKLKNLLNECRKDSEIIIFVSSEGDSSKNMKYRPFKNIEANIINKNSSSEEVHLDISVNTEYKNVHFPNNLTKEEVIFLKEKRTMLLEELQEIEEELGEFK